MSLAHLHYDLSGPGTRDIEEHPHVEIERNEVVSRVIAEQHKERYAEEIGAR